MNPSDLAVAEREVGTRPPGPPPLSVTAAMTTFGSLVWIGLVWAVATVLFACVLGAITLWGELDESLWDQLGAGWQRWLALLAGFTMISEFGRMFVTNGITRAQLARSAAVTLVAIAVLGGVFVTIGYWAEGIVFDGNDWPHRLGDGSTVDGTGALARLWSENAITLAAFFTSGWLLGATYRSRERDEANLWVLPCLVPAAAAVLLIRGDSFVFGFLDRLYLDPPFVLGASVTIAVTLLGVLVATRVTRQIVP
jgi:hypothetical protein